jgi:hypothetical protein
VYAAARKAVGFAPFASHQGFEARAAVKRKIRATGARRHECASIEAFAKEIA